MRLGKEIVVLQLPVLLLEICEFLFELRKTVLHVLIFGFDLLLSFLKGLLFGSLTFTRRVRGGTVPEDTLDSALFLLGVGLCAFSWRKVGSGCREFLAP